MHVRGCSRALHDVHFNPLTVLPFAFALSILAIKRAGAPRACNLFELLLLDKANLRTKLAYPIIPKYKMQSENPFFAFFVSTCTCVFHFSNGHSLSVYLLIIITFRLLRFTQLAIANKPLDKMLNKHGFASVRMYYYYCGCCGGILLVMMVFAGRRVSQY